jgi:hypothetical protein
MCYVLGEGILPFLLIRQSAYTKIRNLIYPDHMLFVAPLRETRPFGFGVLKSCPSLRRRAVA